MSNEFDLFTVGHSTHSYEYFCELLKENQITAVADVRSSPYSRHQRHFSKNELRHELNCDGIAYAFLGEELGGRPKSREFFCEGVADYEKMSSTGDFAKGVSRILNGKNRYKIALMCSEHNPLDCHRCLLVGRALKNIGLKVGNILGNGKIKSQSEIESILLEMASLKDADMFNSPKERLAAAYRDRSMRVAYSSSSMLGARAAE